jgi:urease accessory protein
MIRLTKKLHAPPRDLPLLRLLQLVSPSLPVGAFAYSQGLEWAVEAGWVRNGDGLADWLGDLLQHGLARLDLPILVRQQRAWQAADLGAVAHWNALLLATRETAELRAEEHNRGRALATLLPGLSLEVPGGDWASVAQTQSAGFALAAAAWAIPERDAALGYAWGWLENQVLAAVKAIPLGQTQGQQVLLRLAARIPEALDTALALHSGDIGASAPALAIASSRHETQYTRLFRS